eukprot:GHRR01021278.1.p1 GENE.GHRR01021278.1~~GHRR01021278.1.p1  ORF type:complete len:153 (-),score=33.22 GHRR01021278.1:685-1143(-)
MRSRCRLPKAETHKCHWLLVIYKHYASQLLSSACMHFLVLQPAKTPETDISIVGRLPAPPDPCPANQYLLKQGLPLHVAQAAVNPGFFDPWDVQQVVTLDNPAYRLGPLHLMAGKLDWTLLRGMRVVRKFMGNMDYAASDHRWLLLEVVLRQ